MNISIENINNEILKISVNNEYLDVVCDGDSINKVEEVLEKIIAKLTN